MTRIERFYQLPYLKDLNGLPEKIVEKEEELEESLGDDFKFSKKEYTNEKGKTFILGKINEWYFIGGKNIEYKIFEDKKTIQLHIKKEFEKANEQKKDNEQVDPSWKAFWTREVESL